MRDDTKGVLAMAASAGIWGLSALYYKLLAHVPAEEVLCHRLIWSAVVMLAIMVFSGTLGELRVLFGRWRLLRVVIFASILVSSNQFIYITAIQIDRLTESSLGYFIFPILTVVLGFVFLGERLRLLQQAAVALAVIAVGLLTWGLGVAPWISLFLAGTFSVYGLVKKTLPASAVSTVTAEAMLVTPLALIWLFGVYQLGWTGFSGREGGYFGVSLYESLLLPLAGPLTAIPLVMMSYATRRVTLSTIGLVQYLNPSLQALVAVFVFGEMLTLWHGIAFGLIWFGLALYSLDGMRQEKRRDR